MRLVSSALLVAATLAVAGGLGACVTTTGRFPTEVQAAIAHTSMKRLETDRLVIFYPEKQRELAGRLADRLERCADALTAVTRIDNRHTHEKMFIVVPDAPFNNAYVLPPIAGLQDTAVVPAVNTVDFTTEFGLPPDPASIGCHELTHYVQLKQIAGLWGGVRTVFGDVVSPQVGLDPWFIEGLATYYEARMQPGMGRPRWPVFTGMFHAAYAGGKLSAGDLSEWKRAAVVGNHYLVGTMFISFLAEKYGDAALWRVVELQARSLSIVLSVDGRFNEVYGKDLGELFDEFKAWTAERFPIRPRPVYEQPIRELGTDARWAWAESGAVAVIDNDLDRGTTLTVWEPGGGVRARMRLTDVAPPRTLAVADPLLTSGLGFTRDGRDLYFTAVDRGETYQTTRLLRLRGESLTEITSGLGPGGTISGDGQRYFYLVPDGDRWSLGAYELATGAKSVLWKAEPGQYALTVQASPDSRQLAVSGWNGRKFVIWVHDAATGARLAEVTGPGDRPVYDPSFGPGGKLVFLDVVEGRFQVAIGSTTGRKRIVTDTPYGALGPRVVGDHLRYLARDGLRWTLVDTVLGPLGAPVPQGTDSAAPTFRQEGVRVEAAPAPARPARVLKDGDASVTEGLFNLEERGLALVIAKPTYAVGLTLGGRDRLDRVRWALSGTIDVETKELSGAAALELGVLAPWTLSAFGSDVRQHDQLVDGNGHDAGTIARHDRDAVVALGRTWRDTYGLSLAGVYRTSVVGSEELELKGAEAGLGYAAYDGSPLVGVDRAVVATVSGGYYPRAPLKDLIRGRTSLDLYGPLPFGRRHVLHLGGRVHGLFQDDRALLEVGGADPLSILWSKPEIDTDTHVADVIDPTGDPFTERLRGFEDFALPAYRAILGDFDWTYPLIIDRGVSNVAFLPATFIRELDLEGFGTGSWINYAEELTDIKAHFAVGGAATFKLVLFRVPLSLRYQLSRRLTDDDGVLHLLTLAPG